MIRVGIYGASGYMGGELLRVLLQHPQVEIVWATSLTAESAEKSHRNLYGCEISFVHAQSIDELPDCDVVFFAVPSGIPMDLAKPFLDRGAKIIDVGADFRLRNQAVWEQVYGKTHTAWGVAEEATYGIPELHREEIQQARVVANPGCHASAAILQLAPLIAKKVIDPKHIVVDSLSGTAGAGSELDPSIHHPEITNNIIEYNVVNHRHTYEIEQELGLLTDETISAHLTTSYVPISRGILSIAHCFPLKEWTREQLLDVYREFYADEFFVRIFDMPREEKTSWQWKPYPSVSAVSGTNFCHIGLDIDEQRGRVVVFSVLDSLGKGGSLAGIQNMNLLFGLDETMGLRHWGLHPY